MGLAILSPTSCTERATTTDDNNHKATLTNHQLAAGRLRLTHLELTFLGISLLNPLQKLVLTELLVFLENPEDPDDEYLAYLRLFQYGSHVGMAVFALVLVGAFWAPTGQRPLGRVLFRLEVAYVHCSFRWSLFMPYFDPTIGMFGSEGFVLFLGTIIHAYSQLMFGAHVGILVDFVGGSVVVFSVDLLFQSIFESPGWLARKGSGYQQGTRGQKLVLGLCVVIDCVCSSGKDSARLI